MAYISLLTAVLLVGVDRLTKWLAITYVKPAHTLRIININGNEILNFTYNENRGAAFSILQDKQLFLIIVTSLFLLVVLVILLSKKVKSNLMIWSLAMIIAGGTGNLIDRIANGYVVDFIDFRIIKFAVFNFADMCAVTGAFMLFFSFLIDEYKANKEKKLSINISADNGEDKIE